ncbi:MAG: hypothetical protein Q8906_01865, partial [Bacillota bacterium]|nr:hypothetical protein [Bacillota bacterium]
SSNRLKRAAAVAPPATPPTMMIFFAMIQHSFELVTYLHCVFTESITRKTYRGRGIKKWTKIVHRSYDIYVSFFKWVSKTSIESSTQANQNFPERKMVGLTL